MNLEERIKRAETTVTKMVFPNLLNHHQTMFGGNIISAMTEVGFMTATRFSFDTFVIVSSDHIEFLLPIPEGSMIHVMGKVDHVGHTSITIHVKILLEERGNTQMAVQGFFKFVAIGPDKKSKAIS